jgi:spore coat polysaccharide biosynthesis predicted glycosyltransferase SpsG
MASGENTFTEPLEAEGFKVHFLAEGAHEGADAIAAIVTTSASHRALLVVDSPRPFFYSAAFQSEIRRRGIRLMMIAFRSEGHFAADAVHNQNLLALQENYSTEPWTRLMLGPRYVVLDERYALLRQHRRNPSSTTAARMFLFFGGADTSNLTLRVLKSLVSLERPLQRITAVLGRLNGQKRAISDFVRAHPALPIEVHVDTPDMPDLMAAADIAVTSGGLTIWESACIGLPVVVISTSERERTHSPLLEKRGTCLYLGHQSDVTEPSIREAVDKLIEDVEKRAVMARAGRGLVDGRGTARVIEQMVDLLGEGSSVETKGGKR